MKIKDRRLEAIKLIISSKEIGSQEELLVDLKKEGFLLTQATLSRDLKQLKVAKAASMNGHYVYVLPNETMYKRVHKPLPAAIRHPELIDEIAKRFGSQVCVCAIDARNDADGWHCYIKGGRERTPLRLMDWAREVADRGAGEILFTSMDHDGVKQGFANEALAELSTEVAIPVIASGGAGKKEHFRDAFTLGKADAALAASVFHFGEITIPELKQYLRREGINVRI